MDTPTTQEKFISADAFWELMQTPEYADRDVELLNGVIIERGEFSMSRPAALHGVVAASITHYLFGFVKSEDSGFVTIESGYILLVNPDGQDTVVGPDVAFIRRERLPDGLPAGHIPMPPDFAVEISSPNDTIHKISEKVAAYLKAGTAIVWVVNPDFQTVTVHYPGTIAAYDINGVLDGGDVLPGFTLPVRDIFPA
ncbi:MAG: Uma2 family endonuclease [Armatimonadetes bacterium]|nr:Uma2 family endonuclease [Anaerolineae bacterium]